MTITVDITKAQVIDRGHVFLSLDESPKAQLSRHPELLHRVDSALSFIAMIAGDHEESFRPALIRAALTELVSVEDVQKTLNREGVLSNPALQMNASCDPLLCVARELRNVEIHLSSASLSSGQRELLWGNRDSPEDAQPVNWRLYQIDNLSMGKFRQLRHFNRYDEPAFAEAVRWFDNAQKQWGITEILFRAARSFANELIVHHQL